jgi:HSP20 family molecular chaperone IbpA
MENEAVARRGVRPMSTQMHQVRGSFALPSNADESRIMAIYSHGVLEITVGLANSAAQHARQHIAVRVDHHINPT